MHIAAAPDADNTLLNLTLPPPPPMPVDSNSAPLPPPPPMPAEHSSEAGPPPPEDMEMDMEMVSHAAINLQAQQFSCRSSCVSGFLALRCTVSSKSCHQQSRICASVSALRPRLATDACRARLTHSPSTSSQRA